MITFCVYDLLLQIAYAEAMPDNPEITTSSLTARLLPHQQQDHLVRRLLQRYRPLPAIFSALVPDALMEISPGDGFDMARYFSGVIDQKASPATRHSQKIALIAARMAKFYGWNEDKKAQFTLAAALHDTGKLVVANRLLEKPSKLTSDEFDSMKLHARYTYEILSVRGPGTIMRSWMARDIRSVERRQSLALKTGSSPALIFMKRCARNAPTKRR